MLRRARWISGDRRNSRIPAPEKPHDEFQARRIKQQRALTGHIHRLQPCRNRTSLDVELPVSQSRFFLFSIDEKCERNLIGKLLRALAEKMHPRNILIVLGHAKTSYRTIEDHIP